MTFEEYVATLGPLTRVTPAAGELAEHVEIRQAAETLVQLSKIDREVLSDHVKTHPDWVPVLGLVVGLSRERLKNVLRHEFDTSGWVTLARRRPVELIAA